MAKFIGSEATFVTGRICVRDSWAKSCYICDSLIACFDKEGHIVTINVAALTYDAIVLGCDSFSSLTDTAVFPFRPDGAGFAVDANGDLITDADGNFVVPFAQPYIQTVATTVFAGISKMFHLYEAT